MNERDVRRIVREEMGKEEKPATAWPPKGFPVEYKHHDGGFDDWSIGYSDGEGNAFANKSLWARCANLKVKDWHPIGYDESKAPEWAVGMVFFDDGVWKWTAAPVEEWRERDVIYYYPIKGRA